MTRSRIVWLFALLALTVLLIMAAHDPVRALLREPLTHLALLADTIPQRITWIVVAVLGFAIALSLGRIPHRESAVSSRLRPLSPSQIERLGDLIELAETSVWARDVVRRRLTLMAAGLRSLHRGIHPDEARDEIRTGRWPLDPSLARLLHPEHYGVGRDYVGELAGALDALEGYVQEGDL